MPARAKPLRLPGPVQDELQEGTYAGVFGVAHPREFWDDQRPEEVGDDRREALGRFQLVDYLVRNPAADAAPRSFFALARRWTTRAMALFR